LPTTKWLQIKDRPLGIEIDERAQSADFRKIFVSIAVAEAVTQQKSDADRAKQEQAEAGSISGSVFEIGRPRERADVAVTAFANRLCVDLADKKDRTPAETHQLAACRKEKLPAVKTGTGGTFEIRHLPAGWYSITISWSQGSVPIWCSKPSPEGWVVKNVQAEGDVLLMATSSVFELKASDTLKKDFDWCR
jgi:hypothetical protein